MNNMRRGFTMIELIFVIVIIGILAAVAIPKLAATRDDARVSNIIANARSGLGDMKSYYTSQGNTIWTTATTKELVTDVPFTSDCAAATTGAILNQSLLLCDESDATTGTTCLQFDVNSTAVTVVPTGGSDICDIVVADPAVIGFAGLSTGTGKVHQLGGAGVVR